MTQHCTARKFIQFIKTLLNDVFFGQQKRCSLHNNARTHVSLKTQRKLQNVLWEVMAYPLLHLVRNLLHMTLFLSFSNFVWNKQFNSEKEVITEVDLFHSSKNPHFFSPRMNLLVEHWQKKSSFRTVILTFTYTYTYYLHVH